MVNVHVLVVNLSDMFYKMTFFAEFYYYDYFRNIKFGHTKCVFDFMKSLLHL